jgi:hypothetical protein
MTWETFLVIYFGTDDGIGATEIAKRVESLGFKCNFGPIDFIYKWDHKPTKEEVLKLGDKLCAALKGSGAVFNLDTHD